MPNDAGLTSLKDDGATETYATPELEQRWAKVLGWKKWGREVLEQSLYGYVRMTKIE